MKKMVCPRNLCRITTFIRSEIRRFRGEKTSLNDAFRERQLKPRFAEPNTMEQTIGLKWKELELEEKQLLDEVKQRMQYASEKLQAEIDQMLLDHEAQMIRERK